MIANASSRVSPLAEERGRRPDPAEVPAAEDDPRHADTGAPQVGSLHERDGTRRAGGPQQVLVPAGRFRLSGRTRRLAGARRGRRGDRPRTARGERQSRRARTRPASASRRSSTTARSDAGRFLGCSSDDVIFGTNMTTLDFMLSRTASRDWKEGDKILVSRLDHDGGVAPWIELAADRGFEVDWIDVTDDLRLDLDDLERKLDDRMRVVACVLRVERRRIDHRRAARRGARARSGRTLVDRRGALRGARAGRRAGDRLRRVPLLAVQVLRPASRARLRAPRAARVLAALQGAPCRLDAGRAEVRDRHRAVRAARRLLGDDRVPRVARRHGRAEDVRARPRQRASSRRCRRT